MKQHSKHLPHYFSLIGIFVFAFIGFWVFRYDRAMQVAITVAVAISYFVWGIVHHSVHKDLSFGVVLEYLGISLLGLIVILSLILRT